MSMTGKWSISLFSLLMLALVSVCWRYAHLYNVEKQRADHLARVVVLLADAAKGKVHADDLTNNAWQVELSAPYPDRAEFSPVHHFRYAQVEEPSESVQKRLSQRGVTTTKALLTFGFDAEDRLLQMGWSPP